MVLLFYYVYGQDNYTENFTEEDSNLSMGHGMQGRVNP